MATFATAQAALCLLLSMVRALADSSFYVTVSLVLYNLSPCSLCVSAHVLVCSFVFPGCRVPLRPSATIICTFTVLSTLLSNVIVFLNLT